MSPPELVTLALLAGLHSDGQAVWGHVSALEKFLQLALAAAKSTPTTC